MSTTTATAKLYYCPTSCSAACFIAAHTGNVKVDLEEVSFASHKTASGVDFYTINPKGNIPTLIVGDVILNESSAVLQWIADQAPDSGLAPPNGTIERYQLQNHLNYISSEVHASFHPLFQAKGEAREHALTVLHKKLNYLNKHVVNGKSFIMGNTFTVADSYLYIMLTWTFFVSVSLDEYPNLKSYFEGLKALPNVIAAHKRMAELPHAYNELTAAAQAK